MKGHPEARVPWLSSSPTLSSAETRFYGNCGAGNMLCSSNGAPVEEGIRGLRGA